MNREMTLRKTIKLNADIERVWDALTNPALTPTYMFGCEVLSDWRAGSPILWKGAADGKVYVKGSIVSITPGRQLQYTTFDPNGNLEDVPSNYLTVTVELTPEPGTTTLSVAHGDFAIVADSEKRFNDSLGGWDFALNGLKALVEK